jgi:two-component system CheB/CheR fusion protein
MDNDGRIYRMRLRPYRTINNVIDGIVITLEDITELKQLLEKAERLATVAKDSNDAITLLDLEGKIIAWNRGAEKLYGFSEAEALTMNITEMVPPAKRREALMLTRSMDDPLPEEPLVTERLKKNGDTVQVWLTATRLLDAQKRPAFIATTERDLSKINKEALQNLTGGEHGKG